MKERHSEISDVKPPAVAGGCFKVPKPRAGPGEAQPSHK